MGGLDLREKDKNGRCATVKVKINGVCNNKCRFCTFNSDRSRLSPADMENIISILPNTYYRLIINGGEPTIHPDFVEVSNLLHERLGDFTRLELGTNLKIITTEWGNKKDILGAIIRTYDRIQVGCDDEHGNIDNLENLAPLFSSHGIRVSVNVIGDYCCETTLERIKALSLLDGCDFVVSSLMHDYDDLPLIKHRIHPCRIRNRDLLINCNGDVFFCFQQEHEVPIMNIHTVSQEHLVETLKQHDPGIFKFCSHCHHYISGQWL